MKAVVIGADVSRSLVPKLLGEGWEVELISNSLLKPEEIVKIIRNNELVFVTSPYKPIVGGNLVVNGLVYNTDMQAFDNAYDEIIQGVSYNDLVVILGAGAMGLQLTGMLSRNLGNVRLVGRDSMSNVGCEAKLVINTIPKSVLVYPQIIGKTAIDLNYQEHNPFLGHQAAHGAVCFGGYRMIAYIVANAKQRV